MAFPHLDHVAGWLSDAIAVGTAMAAALVVHWLLFMALRPWAAKSESGTLAMVERRLRGPARWALIAFALSTILPILSLGPHAAGLWTRIAGLLLPALFGWMAVVAVGIAVDAARARADISVADNLRARRRRTRLGILHRIAVFIIVLTAACLMMMSIPAVRSIGVTLIASAGLAALAIGAAAQPALKNLIAGLQMAFTEPIRLDDVVIIEGEWGRIEDIRLTYVVVRLWDDRRLIVPVSKFLEDSFQNWTRETSELLGAVVWFLDPAADIGRLRAQLEHVMAGQPLWDRRFFNMQVVETHADAIEVRALMTARDASAAFDLRCAVREAMLDYIRREMPDALPRHRGDLAVTRPMRPAPSGHP